MRFICLLFINFLNSGNSESSENVKVVKNTKNSENVFKIERQFSEHSGQVPKMICESYVKNLSKNRIFNTSLLSLKFFDGLLSTNCEIISHCVYKFLKNKVFCDENEKFLLLVCYLLGNEKYKNLDEIYSYIIEKKELVELPVKIENKDKKMKDLALFLSKNNQKTIKKQSKNEFFDKKDNVFLFLKQLCSEGFHKDIKNNDQFKIENLDVFSNFLNEIINDSLFISDYLVLNVSYAFMLFAIKNFNLNFTSCHLDYEEFHKRNTLYFLSNQREISKEEVYEDLIQKYMMEHSVGRKRALECVEYNLMYGRSISPYPDSSSDSENSNNSGSESSFDSHLTGNEPEYDSN